MAGASLFNMSEWLTGRGVRVYVAKSRAPGSARRTPVPFTGEYSYANQRHQLASREGVMIPWRLAEDAGREPEHAYGLWKLLVCIGYVRRLHHSNACYFVINE